MDVYMRSCGILLPISSLPGRYGIGTLGKSAYDFVDFLAASGQTWWQTLPNGPTGAGDSPYQPFSAFAGNPYFIDPGILAAQGLLSEADRAGSEYPGNSALVDYGFLYDTRETLLRRAFMNFADHQKLERFSTENARWLEPYALFMALRQFFGGVPWLEWDTPCKLRDPAAMEAARYRLSDEIRFHRFMQYQFFSQWQGLKSYANSKGVYIFGDVPIYCAPDSADVWSNPGLFELDGNGFPAAVSGCPPDGFAPDGQVWGSPLYRWDVMEADSFSWWRSRLDMELIKNDRVRLDHFIGFSRYYSIPGGSGSSRGGRFMQGPGIKLFRALEDELGSLRPLVAEDLGVVTGEVRGLLRETDIPGMRVMQFAFDSGDSPYLPHNYTQSCVAYAGTHDNPPICGWYGELDENRKSLCKRYIGAKTGKDVPEAMIRSLYASSADTVIIQLQDWLGLGCSARINVPGSPSGNWRWRLDASSLTNQLKARISELTLLYSRGTH